MELPTENIQYDLMAYDNTLSIQCCRVNICRDIHFEPCAMPYRQATASAWRTHR